MNITTITTLIEKNKINYDKIINDNISVVYNNEDFFDLNIIIPVRNREKFAKPLYNSFIKAAENCILKISFTFVEHSEFPIHSKFCKQNKINYFWIKSEPGELFNKCLAHNIGAFFSPKSEYLLFHDIDCLVQSDFFLKLFDNIKNKSAGAIQNFTGRRVLYVNEELTNRIINEEFDVDNLSIDLQEVSLPMFIGAPGGSITIKRDLFFKVGGYDPELFLANSPEDIFFWDKVETIDNMYICDNPNIEIYHMNHMPTYMDNPFINEMKLVYETFKNSTKEEREEIINKKSDLIKQFI
jgi:hypothetical protein